MMDAYVPVTSLLYVLLFILGGYICYLIGYRRALADFPVDDVEHDEVAQLSLRQTSTQERLTALEEWQEFAGMPIERVDELERVNTKTEFDKRVEASIPFSSWALRVKDQRAIDTARLDTRINNLARDLGFADLGELKKG